MVIMVMPTEQAREAPVSALLSLIWLASPALPIGGFSYSEGLEAAVDHGLVTNEASATGWLTTQLELVQARGDMALIAKAIPALKTNDFAEASRLNQWVLMTRETAEMRLQSVQMGRSLLDLLRNLNRLTSAQARWVETQTPTLPMMMALAFANSDASVTHALHAYSFGWAENMTQAAIKTIPLGQSAGQRMLMALARAIPTAVDRAIALPEEDRVAFAPHLAILSSRHEHQYSRLFRS
jgi:urease accessory protein